MLRFRKAAACTVAICFAAILHGAAIDAADEQMIVGDKTQNAVDLLNEARQYIADEDYENSVVLTSRVINEVGIIDEHLAAAFRLRGSARLRTNDHEGAIADFTEALRLRYDDVWALWQRCWANTQIGAFAAARRDCDVARRLVRKNPQLYSDGVTEEAIKAADAEWFRLVGMPQTAIQILDPILDSQVNQNDWRLFFQVGNTRVSLGDYHGALEAYTSAIEVAPETWNAEIYGNRGKAHLALGFYAEAEDDLHSALGQDPSNIEYRHLSCSLYLLMKEHQEALANCAIPFQDQPQDTSFINGYGLALIRNEQYELASQVLTSGLEKSPSDWSLRVHLYLARLALGDRSESREILEGIRDELIDNSNFSPR